MIFSMLRTHLIRSEVQLRNARCLLLSSKTELVSFRGARCWHLQSRLVNDTDADKKLHRYIKEFIGNAPLLNSRRVFARLRRRFAAVYAGTALAIDYNILPFDKRKTLHDIRKCMNDAIDLLIQNEARASDSAAPHLSDDHLIADFRRQIVKARLIKVGRYANRAKPLTVQEIKAAHGIVKFDEPSKFRVMIPTSQMAAWYQDKPTRNRLVALLRKRKIFGRGRQPDTAARQIMIRPYATKIPCYRVFLKALGLERKDLQVG